MASVSIYCDFCLKYGIKVYNVCRKVQADIEPSLGATMIMDLVSDLIKLRHGCMPNYACRDCLWKIIQFHWFKVQIGQASEATKGAGTDGSCSTDILDAFKSTRTRIGQLQKITDKELSLATNVVKEETVEILSYEDSSRVEKPSSTPQTETQKVPRKVPPELKIRIGEKQVRKKTADGKPKYTREEIKQRPALCTVCGIRFVRKDYLKLHMRRHTGDLPYTCNYCGKSFPRTTDLNVHVRYHTNEKSHFCTVCNKGFNRPYNLKVHLRVHTRDRPYKCPHCPKAYTQSNDLKTHIRIHTGERFKCDICEESFVLPHRLTQHKKVVHKMEVVSKIGRLAKFEA